MPNAFSTVKLGVPDLQAAADFYGAVLGMEIGAKMDAYCEWEMLFPGSPRAQLILYDTTHGTLAHRMIGPGFLVFTVDDLQEVCTRFRAAGITRFSEPKHAPEFGVDYVITEDPFGNVIELSQFVE